MKAPVGFIPKASTSRLLLPFMLAFCIANCSQIPLYPESTRALYRLFFVSDFLATLGESFLFLLMLAAASRGGLEPLRRLLIRINATVLVLVPIGVDRAENVGFLIAIERYPVRSGLVVSLAVLLHQVRIALLPIVLGCLLLTQTLGIFLRRQRRTRRGRPLAGAGPGVAGETA